MRWLLLLALFLIPLRTEAADPRVYRGEETLFEDTVWEGDVLIDGILTIAPDVTLEIRPGTTVRFTPSDVNGDGIGEHEIFIQGSLRALGAPGRPVIFTAAGENPFPGAWGAINMMGSEGGNLLTHCIFEHAYRGFHAHFSTVELRDSVFRGNVRGVQFQESTVSFNNCRVTDNLNGMQFRDSKVVLQDSVISGNYWGVRCVYSDVVLRGCRIEENLINGANLRDSSVLAEGNLFRKNRRGLYLQKSRGTMAGNRIVESSEHGIFLEESDCRVLSNRISGNGRAGVKWVNSSGTLRENLLGGNGEYALVNDGTGPIDARGNGWGTTEASAISQLVRDGADRPGMGIVDFAGPLSGDQKR